MKSVFDELSDKLKRDPGLARRAGPRADIGLMLYNQREEVRALWLAAEACLRALDRAGGASTGGAAGEASGASFGGDARGALAELRRTVEQLRPFFGERWARPSPASIRGAVRAVSFGGSGAGRRAAVRGAAAGCGLAALRDIVDIDQDGAVRQEES